MNQLVSTQDMIHEYSYEMGSVSALTNQIAFLEKIDIELCWLICKSSLKIAFCYIIVCKTVLILTSMLNFAI